MRRARNGAVAEREAWRGDPLPRGRHKLSPDTVRASQRERLIRAMLETVAERGYEGTTVPQVVARARVSRNAFYEFFADKTDCFIAACDEEGADLLQTVLAAGAAAADWVSALRMGAREYLRWWQERPALTRAYFTGLPQAGQPAIAQRERQYASFRAILADLGRRARLEQPSLPPLREVVPRVLVMAITELVAEAVRNGNTEQLTRLEDEIVFVSVKLLAADDAAQRAIA